MDKSTARQLIIKYNEGSITAAEEQLLEQHIEAGLIELDELDDLRQINQQLDLVMQQAPEVRIHEQFKAMLSEEKNNLDAGSNWSDWWNRLFGHSNSMRFAYSLALVALGFATSWWMFSGAADNNDPAMEMMASEIKDLREMMMLTMLEKESVSDRLKAVSLTKDMQTINEKMADALFQTLNQDRNVNVRLASLEALYAYADAPKVREGLIYAIQYQEDPLVQMALAEMMVALQEKGSVDALKRLLEKEELIEEAREKIEASVSEIVEL